MEILVFKTSVQDSIMVSALKPSLDRLAGSGAWNFDLSDCDKILRINSPQLKSEDAITLMQRFGVQCVELD